MVVVVNIVAMVAGVLGGYSLKEKTNGTCREITKARGKNRAGCC